MSIIILIIRNFLSSIHNLGRWWKNWDIRQHEKYSY